MSAKGRGTIFLRERKDCFNLPEVDKDVRKTEWERNKRLFLEVWSEKLKLLGNILFFCRDFRSILALLMKLCLFPNFESLEKQTEAY